MPADCLASLLYIQVGNFRADHFLSWISLGFYFMIIWFGDYVSVYLKIKTSWGCWNLTSLTGDSKGMVGRSKEKLSFCIKDEFLFKLL